MNSLLVVDLFVEDRAHEEFLKPLIARIAAEERVQFSSRPRSARGGAGRALEEFELYQDVLEKGGLGDKPPDLLVVGIDGNCATFAEKREQIRKATRPLFSDRLVAACPDPHIERWYLADPESFSSVVGSRPKIGRRKCVRDHYKKALAKAVRAAGHPVTLGGIEFAWDLVAAMDLYRAGTKNHSLRAFVNDLRAKFRQARNE
jgi:hypothetical protein